MLFAKAKKFQIFENNEDSYSCIIETEAFHEYSKFYMNMCIKERLSKRELERQIDSGNYERYMLSQKPLTPAIEESRRATGNVFLDNYVLDFLDVPETVSEYNLKLIDKKLLQKKLKEYVELAGTVPGEE